MTSDSSGAYESQSQQYSFGGSLSQGSQGESQERKGSFLNSNGKRGLSSAARPPSGPAAYSNKDSSSVSAYLNSVTKSSQVVRAPSPVFDKMRSSLGKSALASGPHGAASGPGDLQSVVSALRDRHLLSYSSFSRSCALMIFAPAEALLLQSY